VGRARSWSARCIADARSAALGPFVGGQLLGPLRDPDRGRALRHRGPQRPPACAGGAARSSWPTKARCSRRGRSDLQPSAQAKRLACWSGHVVIASAARRAPGRHASSSPPRIESLRLLVQAGQFRPISTTVGRRRGDRAASPLASRGRPAPDRALLFTRYRRARELTVSDPAVER